MNRATALFSLAVVISLLVSPSAGAIVYGEFDGNQHPNVGTFVVEIEGEKVSVCSGTLIAPTVFLTASHCTDFVEQALGTSDVWVTFDPVFSESSTLIPGTTHTNPAYNRFQGPGGRSDPGDIAVIVLDEAVALAPAQLPAEGLLDELKASGQLKSQNFTAVGYGTVRETRKKAFESILDNEERRFGLQGFLSLQNAWLTLAMNEATGNAGTCYGDSGGPHFLGGPDSNLVVSITVTGDAPCKATDVTYRLDTPSARTFLANFVSLP